MIHENLLIEHGFLEEEEENRFKLSPKEEPKQETLEEAAAKYPYGGREGSQRKAFIEGAKWQAERMYSEEDMKSFADWVRNGLLNIEYSVDKLDKHLEQWKQFKKK